MLESQMSDRDSAQLERVEARIAAAERDLAKAENLAVASEIRGLLKSLLECQNLLFAKQNLIIQGQIQGDTPPLSCDDAMVHGVLCRSQLHMRADSDFVGQFKKKLAEEHITTPNPLAMQRLVLNFPGPMLAAAQRSADPHIARLLYEQAMCLPGTETRLLLADQGISVNSCVRDDRPSLLTAVDLRSGSLLVLKPLPRGSEEQKTAARAELQALDLLDLHSQPEGGVLVPMQLVTVGVDPKDATPLGMAAETYRAVRTPMFATSLDRAPQMTEEFIHQGGKRLQAALHIMHAKGLVHADVKAANVFLNHATKWCLGDYGSCLKIDERIVSCTEVRCRFPCLRVLQVLANADVTSNCMRAAQGWYPGQLRFAQAQPKHDWGLLVVLLAVELDKANTRGLVGDSSPQKVQMDLLLARCQTVTHAGLKALLRELVSNAGWELPEEPHA
jgi:hypothetical protein